MIEKLKELLKLKIYDLKGDYIKKNSNYEEELSNRLWFKSDKWRYWDADFHWLKIEFKKWKSIWLDLVRYAEIFLEVNDESKEKTITLFFIPDKNKNDIVEIIWIFTAKIIAKLSIDKNIANNLMILKERVPRSLNAQASLTLKDIREISDFTIDKNS